MSYCLNIPAENGQHRQLARTSRRGGHNSRPVQTPLGAFPSMTAAATAHGCTYQNVQNKVRLGRPGWLSLSPQPAGE